MLLVARICLLCLLTWSTTVISEEDIVLQIIIDLEHPVSNTPGSKYIGVNIDTSFLVHGHLAQLDLSSPKLQAVLKALSPSYVRVGGTAADAMMFNNTLLKQFNNTIGPSVLDKLWDLSKTAGWDVIFDINVLVRKGGHWDPSNARELLRYTSEQGYNIPCFQLGNEPNIFPNKYNTTLTPQALAEDYQSFRSFLQEFPLYQDSCILGPEVTEFTKPGPQQYFQQFLKAGGGKGLTAIGVHHYVCLYDNPISVDFFTNKTVMELLKDELEALTSIARQYVPHLPLWLDETSSTYSQCPGDVDLRKTYANGFLWLDKLGMSALYGIQHLNRQEMFWELVDQDFDPLPDYYLTVLYKRLVQGPVFKVLTSVSSVRMYAHCANPASYPSGAIVVYVINLQTIDVVLDLSQFLGQHLDLYLLTPGDHRGFIPSRTVALNGKQLMMTGNELPSLHPKTVIGPSYKMEARTFGFVVIPQANVSACKTS